MITNETQYRATAAHLGQFEEALANLEATAAQAPDAKLRTLEIDAVRAQADDLRTEIAEYEALRTGSIDTFEAGSLPDLATALIKARIARGWTQRDLAERLGVAEQQIQRYESTQYTSDSLARLSDIAKALDIDVRETVSLRKPGAA